MVTALLGAPRVCAVTTESAAVPQRRRAPYVALVVAFLCVALQGVSLAWAFLSMRGVMGVGGSCASGGPYEIATPCPDGTWLIALAIPMLLITMFAGSGFSAAVGGPTLILPMWGLLFTTLGWNFLEYGLTGGIEWGFLVPGVLFWVMGLPALYAIGVGFVKALRTTPDPEKTPNPWGLPARAAALWWWPVYTALYVVGAMLGLGTYTVIAT